MSDPLIDAANAIGAGSPRIRAFAQLAAQRIVALGGNPPPPAYSIPTVLAACPANGGIGAWAYATSPATPRLAPNGSGAHGRYLASGERFWIHWPVYLYGVIGNPDICLNLHDVPAASYDWGRVSPVHVQWARDHWQVTREYGGQVDIDCPAARGVANGWDLLTLELTVGDKTNGQCGVYWNGLSVGSFGGPTLNPGTGDTGKPFSPYLQAWQGAYPGPQAAASGSISALALFSPAGGTVEQALADTPSIFHIEIPDGVSRVTTGTPLSAAVVAALWHRT